MNSGRHSTVVFTILLFISTFAAAVTLRQIDRIRAGASLEEALYIPSPTVLRRLSLGYTGLLADIYWTRVVQYFGGKHHQQAQRYDLLQPLLDITTTLDPHLIAAYQFGSIFLAQQPPEGAGMPDAAVALVQRGIRENPDDWSLFYHLGFIHYIERQDYAAAAQAFERGSHLPGAHPWMKVLAAAMAQHGGDPETARFLWTKIYESSDDQFIRANAVKHMRAMRVDDEVAKLEALLGKYRQQTGRLPRTFLEMISAGWLRALPVDPLGRPYKLMPDGRVEVQSPDDLPFIHRGLPRGEQASLFAVPESKKAK